MDVLLDLIMLRFVLCTSLESDVRTQRAIRLNGFWCHDSGMRNVVQQLYTSAG